MNWLENIIGKRIQSIIHVGWVHGSKVYCVVFLDGSEEDWFIDFDNKTAEFYYRKEQ